MSLLGEFFVLAAVEIGGLFLIWFLIRARVRRFLELENLLAGVREEARALVLELNATADRNVSLVEDRLAALRGLLDEVDRRIGVERKELATRDKEREVYASLSRRRPIVPPPSETPSPEERPAGPGPAREGRSVSPEPIRLALGREADLPLRSSAFPEPAPRIEPAPTPIVPGASRREEVLELYRQGFSPELIAARVGGTVAEIELLVEIEERRASARGGLS